MTAPEDGEMAGTLEAFSQRAEVLTGERATAIRERFKQAFLDRSHPWYRDGIEDLKEFSDGRFYTRFMRDFLRHFRSASEAEVWEECLRHDELIVLWDIHSADRIHIPDYWKFPRDPVLVGAPEAFRSGQHLLPNDLYLFDSTFSWAGVLTSDYSHEQERMCALATP